MHSQVVYVTLLTMRCFSSITNITVQQTGQDCQPGIHDDTGHLGNGMSKVWSCGKCQPLDGQGTAQLEFRSRLCHV